MSDGEDNFIEIEEDEEGGDNKVCKYNILFLFLLILQEGMDFDINKAVKDCE